MRTLASVTLCFGLTVGLGGCRHKTQVVILPAVLTPVALEDIPGPENLPMVAVQQSNLPPVPAVASAEKPKRERKKPAPKAPVPEPVQIAIVAGEKAQVSKVKNFLKDAQEALKTGDAEGAKTLATKAKLLLDDLEK